MTDELKLLPIDIEYIIEKTKTWIDEAEEDSYSSSDELINIGKREAFDKVMPLLYALKRRHPNQAMHSDGEGRCPNK